MSSSKRRDHKHGTGRPSADAARGTGGVPAQPVWKWKTFPVYFAFSLGAFFGLYAGLAVAKNPDLLLVVSTVFALMLGLGFSRVTSRWLIRRRIIKPRVQPAK